MTEAAVSRFGRQLRHWRAARGMSQLDLAVAAGTTAWHLSFVETGRSRPGADLVLRGHEPYPAWAIGRGLRFLAANTGAETLFPGLTSTSPREIVERWFGPGPFRDRVANWPDVVRATLTTLRREAVLTGDDEVVALLHRAEELAGDVPESTGAGQAPVACPVLRVDGHLLRTISTVMRFDTATEVTTSELRVELMFPADDLSDRLLRELAGRQPHGTPVP